MFNDMIRAHDLSIWPVTGLMIFFVFMLGVFVWTLWPSRKATFDRLRFAALDAEPTTTPRKER